MKMIGLNKTLKLWTAGALLILYCLGSSCNESSISIPPISNKPYIDSLKASLVLDSSVYSTPLYPNNEFIQLSFERKSAIQFGLYLDSISIEGNSYSTESRIIGVQEDSNYLTVECYVHKQTYNYSKADINIFAMSIEDLEDELYLIGDNYLLSPRAAQPHNYGAQATLHFRKLNHKVVNKINFGNSIDTSSVHWVREVYE